VAAVDMASGSRLPVRKAGRQNYAPDGQIASASFTRSWGIDNWYTKGRSSVYARRLWSGRGDYDEEK
jgi:hypothetical protein